MDINAIRDVRGFLAACLVDGERGMMLDSAVAEPGYDIDAAASAHIEVVKAKRAAMRALGLKRNIDDILITLGTQFHLIRPLADRAGLFLFVALDRKAADLGMARLALRKVEAKVAM